MRSDLSLSMARQICIQLHNLRSDLYITVKYEEWFVLEHREWFLYSCTICRMNFTWLYSMRSVMFSLSYRFKWNGDRTWMLEYLHVCFNQSGTVDLNRKLLWIVFFTEKDEIHTCFSVVRVRVYHFMNAVSWNWQQFKRKDCQRTILSSHGRFVHRKRKHISQS